VQDHEHAPDHEHQVVPSDVALRVKSLESLLVEKGLVDPAALDALVDAYEHKLGPRNGAQAIARAWVDPPYKKRLLADAATAIAEFGLRTSTACGLLRSKTPHSAQPDRLHAVLVISVTRRRVK
jgi:hypothetical protein